MSAIGLYTGQYIWGANNIYDPIQSGGGNQPYYYDQLIAPTSRRHRSLQVLESQWLKD